VGRFARSDRVAARQRAALDAPTFLAAERERLARIHHELNLQAAAWWQALVANEELTVCEAVNAAFADNPAAGCAVGLCGDVLSVVLRQQDLDALPTQTPGLTAAGRPTLKTMAKRDRLLWWLTIMGSNVIATVKEALATALNVNAVELAVLTRLPNDQRLGVVAYGRWTRQGIESTTWREPEDAMRFLDIGEDIVCAVATSTSKISRIDTSGIPGLQQLVDTAVDDGLDAPVAPEPAASDHYAIVAFERWINPPGEPAATRPEPHRLVAGQNLVLPDEALVDLGLDFSFSGAEADMTLLLLASNDKVRSDDDFAFYNQPITAEGAVRLLGKDSDGTRSTERASVRLSALPAAINKVVVSINMDVGNGFTCGELRDAALTASCPTAAWIVPTPADPRIRAMVLVELYRHLVDGDRVWKLRAVSQGWAEGLPALARAHGVDVT
jgi:stress response protein SCP2